MIQRTKRSLNPFLSRSFQRTLGALTRTALRAGSKVVAKALRAAPSRPKRKAAKRTAAKRPPAKRTLARIGAAKSTRAKSATAKSAATPAGSWSTGSAAGARRYRLYQPPGVVRTERLPLLVMLHGCAQDAQALADSSRINRIAARERFMVLYPEQNPKGPDASRMIWAFAAKQFARPARH